MKLFIKQLLREGFFTENKNQTEETLLKDMVSKYPELIKHYDTGFSTKYTINSDDKLRDKKGDSLPRFDFEYWYQPKFGEPMWDVSKHDYTPYGRRRDKILLSSNDINEVHKLMVKCIKFLLKNTN